MNSIPNPPGVAYIPAIVLRVSNDVRPVMLLGAGASSRLGVPLAAEAVKQIARLAYIRHELGGRAHLSQVKYSQWMTSLSGQEWFIHEKDRLAENFSLAIEHPLYLDEFRREVLLSLMESVHDISSGYSPLAEFMLRGLVCTILTTNFDFCLPCAFQARKNISTAICSGEACVRESDW